MIWSRDQRVSIALATLLALHSRAQLCTPQWITSADQGLLGSEIACIVPWDPDGPGPRGFELAIVNNGVSAESIRGNSILLWNGAHWSIAPGDPAFVSGAFGSVSKSFAWHSEQVGKDFLFAAGTFRDPTNSFRMYLYCYDRVSWSMPGGVGPNSEIIDMIAFDRDGDGPNPSVLVCCGRFDRFGNIPISQVACFDGVEWKQFGRTYEDLGQLVAVDFDGNGSQLPRLFAVNSHGSRVLELRGDTWSPADLTVEGRINAVGVRSIGDSSAYRQEIVFGGVFSSMNGVECRNVVSWDGENVSPFGTDLEMSVTKLVCTTGPRVESESRLIALAGDVRVANAGDSAAIVAEWDGDRWVTIGVSQGIDGGSIDGVLLPTPQDDAGDESLYVRGNFNNLNQTEVFHIAAWNGERWDPLGNGSSGPVSLLTPWTGSDYGGGSPVLVGVVPAVLGGVRMDGRLAEWNGVTWRAISGCPVKAIRAIGTFDPDGPGIAREWLLVSGSNSNSDAADRIYRWNGDAWYDMGQPPLSTPGGRCRVHCFASLSSPERAESPELFVGGSFSESGIFSAKCVAKWTGSDWVLAGSNLITSSTIPTVYAMAAHDFDGGGPQPEKLVITGNFAIPRRVAVLEGDTFVVLGPNGAALDGRAITVVPAAVLGGTSELFVSGIVNAGSSLIVRWNGTKLEEIGRTNGTRVLMGGFPIDSLDASQQRLVVAGDFTEISAQPAKRIAYFDGTLWKTLAGGLPDTALGLQAFGGDRSKEGPVELLVGGSFTWCGTGTVSRGWARVAIRRSPSRIILDSDVTAKRFGVATIIARVSPGYGDLGLQWFREHLPLRDGVQPSGSVVIGSGTRSLKLQGLRSEDAGAYQLRAIDECQTGAVWSNGIRLAVEVGCAGDFDSSGIVDDADFQVFSDQYDEVVCSAITSLIGCVADIDQNGLVNDEDFVLFAAAYSRCRCTD